MTLCFGEFVDNIPRQLLGLPLDTGVDLVIVAHFPSWPFQNQIPGRLPGRRRPSVNGSNASDVHS
jgi:hypothetical protein